MMISYKLAKWTKTIVFTTTKKTKLLIQMTWGAHWAVPAAGVGGTDGFSALHFPSIGTFLNIPDDYD